ncbi:tetratricopeptide repeat protein [Aurantiacibacter gangjinensis]|uniref:tetratricopeptide repeat protein n=1 Tax=Aurantiacibacter gangjinensis TaxID=502682 RepID=UPI00069983EF|nr:tetratricopeptide repeat protein [Aurantiacibacter gangjinensis]APE28515.1 TPR domain protein [Aurantiacibacter gangjinensis]
MTDLAAARQANSQGHAAMKAGQTAEAEAHFARAVDQAPDDPQFRLNHAIALNALGRSGDAMAALQQCEAEGQSNPAYCSTRGAVARALDRRDEAAHWYDRALALDPARVRALHGRARVAIERAEADALDRFDRALQANPGDVDLWLGKAQALDVAGDTAAAREIAEKLVTQLPQYADGLRFLAQLRLAAGDTDYTSHYTDAANKVPANPAIPQDHASLLAGLEDYAGALAVAEKARTAFPDIQQFALMEATFAGALGQDDHAEALFGTISLDDAQRWTQEARHALRIGDTERAGTAVERALARDPASVSAWALRGLLWRLADDPRAHWLHEQDGLVQMVDLQDADIVLPPAIAMLHDLHDGSPLPLGQSLRGGTQTRGNLFDRMEPELRALRDAILATLKEYRAALPAYDAAHPLLRHRNAPWTISGSWSVRLAGGGDHHAAHVHPAGILSSALYCELPDEVEKSHEHAGWLELGRPSIDLPLDLPPLETLQPRVGALALFPSTLYHGTRPFEGGRRMTVAFDVTLGDGVAP